MNDLEFGSLSDLGLPLFNQALNEETEKSRKLKHFAKLTAKYAPTDVIVGAVTSVWEDYATNRLYATVEYPVQNDDFIGVYKVECFIGVDTPVDVVRMTRSVYEGRVLVVDKETKQIIASHTSYF